MAGTEEEEEGPNPANPGGSRGYFQPLPVALAAAAPAPPSSISQQLAGGLSCPLR